MREFITATAFVALLSAASTANAANPYEVFRLGMSEAGVREAVHGMGSTAAPDESDGEHCEEGRCAFMSMLRLNEGDTEAIFFFESDKLVLMTLSYYFLPHMAQPYKTAAECRNTFREIESSISTVFGEKAEEMGSIEEDWFGMTWKMPGATVSAAMDIDKHGYLDASGPLCGTLSTIAFAGSPEKLKTFLKFQ